MSESEPREQLPPILVGDMSRGGLRPGGSLFGFVQRRDDMDGAPSPGSASSGYADPSNWVLIDAGVGIGGSRDRRMAVRLVDDGDGTRTTRVVDASGSEAPISSLMRVVRVQRAPMLAIRVSGGQIDPGLAVSPLLRNGWRPRQTVITSGVG